MATHTKDQEEIVLRILSYKSHEYYKILSCDKSATDVDLKKSYRKLAIKLHPDKNPHPRSSEAFKFINKAFEVLGDPSKRKIFDQTGSDPDSRFAGYSNDNDFAGASGEARHRSPFAGGQMPQGFDEDIFNMFFGDGFRGGGGGGPQTFSFGPNGFTFQTFGGPGGQSFFPGGRTRTQTQNPRQRDQTPASVWDTVKQLLPLLLFIIVPIISSFFSESTSPPPYSFEPTRKFTVERHTPKHEIPFYIQRQTKDSLSDKQLRDFELKVENNHIQGLRRGCSREQMYKNQLIDDAQGWFFIDEEKMKIAENLPMSNCERLRGMKLL